MCGTANGALPPEATYIESFSGRHVKSFQILSVLHRQAGHVISHHDNLPVPIEIEEGFCATRLQDYTRDPQDSYLSVTQVMWHRHSRPFTVTFALQTDFQSVSNCKAQSAAYLRFVLSDVHLQTQKTSAQTLDTGWK